MTSFVLRIIAIIAMLLDHTAYVLVDPASDAYTIMRTIGRVAFPIFCFLIVEGFEHTRSLPKYIGRLALLAVISEIPFDLAFHHTVLEFSGGQNVFLTLLFGLLAITAIGKGAPRLIKLLAPDTELDENPWLRLLAASPAVFLCGLAAHLLDTDYGWCGVAFICIFYIFRSQRALALICFAILNSVHYCMSFSEFTNPRTIFSYSIYGLNTVQWLAPLAAIPIGLYNGKPGTKKLRNLFYAFYPAHLLVLWVLTYII